MLALCSGAGALQVSLCQRVTLYPMLALRRFPIWLLSAPAPNAARHARFCLLTAISFCELAQRCHPSPAFDCRALHCHAGDLTTNPDTSDERFCRGTAFNA